MRDVKRILELRSQNYSQRSIATTLKISRRTVSKVFNAADEKDIYWSNVRELGTVEIESLLFGKEEINLKLKEPDINYVHKELLKPGVTLKLLWEEYVADCRSGSLPYYHYSYYAELYSDYVNKHNLTMHINHKPAQRMQVDWFGETMQVTDSLTGEVITAYLFEATLPFSMFSYVQACPSMDIKYWIDCHKNAYLYFGGVTKLLIPDNLKTGVISHKKYEDPVLNRTYQEMADYYDTVIIPTRVRSPKDKAAVEGSVGDCTTAIIAKLRNRKFFSFEELNKAILKVLSEFNEKPFQKREGSRKQVFIEEELEFLKPLPLLPYELSEWKKAKVNLNYHILVGKNYYSVPYEYVGEYVDVKVNSHTLTVFYKGNQITSHPIIKGRKYQYATQESHMPENHQRYQWNKERFLKWSLAVGKYTNEVVTKIFDRYRYEEQAYNGCMSLLKLSDKYGAARLESACQLALDHLDKPGYKNIKMIIESGQDIKEKETKDKNESIEKHAFVRGADYYGGKQ